ncbi:MAG: S49 family peptidase [Planctomycetaceae bacterium]
MFKQHVVDVRGEKLAKPIDELAGGRVFTGRQALEFGLIDELGGLDAAIAAAAKAAGLKSYDVRVVPEPENFLEALLGDVGGNSSNDPPRLGLRAEGAGTSLWDAALPMLKGIDPQRLRLLRAAFQQLELIEQEQVIMAAPVFEFRSSR